MSETSGGRQGSGSDHLTAQVAAWGERYTRVPNAVALDARLGAADRAVYQALLSFCYHGRVCYPSLELLARVSGQSRRTVQRSLGRLAAVGWIEKGWGRSAGARQGHAVYTITGPFVEDSGSRQHWGERGHE